MTTETVTQAATAIPAALKLAELPSLGAPLAGGLYAGITTLPDGATVAVVLLPGRGERLTWKKAQTWAKQQGGQLPSRLVAALLFAHLKSHLPREWHWTDEALDASSAWGCFFDYGFQDCIRKIAQLCAVAVRLIPVEVQSFGPFEAADEGAAA